MRSIARVVEQVGGRVVRDRRCRSTPVATLGDRRTASPPSSSSKSGGQRHPDEAHARAGAPTSRTSRSPAAGASTVQRRAHRRPSTASSISSSEPLPRIIACSRTGNSTWRRQRRHQRRPHRPSGIAVDRDARRGAAPSSRLQCRTAARKGFSIASSLTNPARGLDGVAVGSTCTSCRIVPVMRLASAAEASAPVDEIHVVASRHVMPRPASRSSPVRRIVHLARVAKAELLVERAHRHAPARRHATGRREATPQPAALPRSPSAWRPCAPKPRPLMPARRSIRRQM